MSGMWERGAELKVGLFAAAVLLLVIFMTLRVSDHGVYRHGTYEVYAVLESAEGLTPKTPVELAGIQVGHIQEVALVDGRRARLRLKISREVRLGKDARIQVRTKGFLGDNYLDLIPGSLDQGVVPPGGEIAGSNPYVDLGQFASKALGLSDSIQSLVEKLTDLTEKNQENITELISSLSQLTSDLSDLVSEKKETLKETMERIRSITQKVDEEAVPAFTQAAEGARDTLAGVNRFQFEVGYHLEYLGETKSFKNYVGMTLRPRPDKYFLLEFITDPNPSPIDTTTTTVATTGGVTTTTVTDESKIQHDKVLISAELAKSFYNFTLRGGLIESRGGVGLDYTVGPVGVQFSAFDFRSDNGQRPHLKAMGQLNLTQNLFLVSGVDDFVSKQQSPDWFVGAGLRLIDDDIKSLFGVTAIGSSNLAR